MIRLTPRPSARREVDRLLTSRYAIPPDHNDLLLINANASSLRIERRWSRSRFAELAQRLLECYPELRLVFIGSAQEKPYVDSLCARIACPGDRICNVAGKLTFEMLVALFERVRLVVTNDTGPMHLAAAMRKHTVALFGPCSPDQYGKLPGVFPIYANVYCSPCVHEFNTPPCKGKNACMDAIAAETVLATVKKALAGTLFNQHYQTPAIQYSACENDEPLGIVFRKY